MGAKQLSLKPEIIEYVNTGSGSLTADVSDAISFSSPRREKMSIT